MYTRGDVVRSIDPFKLGDEAERFWLVVNDDRHPFADEQFIAVALTTTPHEPATAISERDWAAGGLPRRSYVLPWAFHSPRIEDVSDRVGRLSESLCESILQTAREYLTPER